MSIPQDYTPGAVVAPNPFRPDRYFYFVDGAEITTLPEGTIVAVDTDGYLLTRQEALDLVCGLLRGHLELAPDSIDQMNQRRWSEEVNGK